MKKLVSRITIALLVTLYACYPAHVLAVTFGEGRYQGVPAGVGNNTKYGVWVVDTKTGKVKFCQRVTAVADEVKCSYSSLAFGE